MFFLSEGYCDKNSLLVFTHNNTESAQIAIECKNAGISYFLEDINNHHETLASFKPDLLISCYYRFIVSQKILDLPKVGSYNIHPSLLPYYKGTFSSPWAIINDEKFTGVSIHEMLAEVDMGRIICQEKIEIRKFDTAYTLYHRLVSLAIKMLPLAIKQILSGADGVPQAPILEPSKSYYPRKVPFGGCIIASKTTFEDACRFVRAMHFPPHKPGKIVFEDSSIHEFTSIEDLIPFRQQFLVSGD